MKSRKQRIAEIEQDIQGWTNGVDTCKEDCNELAQDDLKKALDLIKELQQENKKLKQQLEKK